MRSIGFMDHNLLSAGAETVKDDGRSRADRQMVPAVAATNRLEHVVGASEELPGEPPAGAEDEQLGPSLDGQARTERGEGQPRSALAGGRRDQPRQRARLTLDVGDDAVEVPCQPYAGEEIGTPRERQAERRLSPPAADRRMVAGEEHRRDARAAKLLGTCVL